jgi:Trk K+ transport system NAD-binding subunit
VKRSSRRLLAIALVFPAVLIVVALLYMAGMRWLEGEPRDFWAALTWASGAMSTTGFGADVTWHHPAMVLFAVVVQFSGVILVFLVLPIYLIPFFEERFEARLPRQVPRLERHLVVVGHGPEVEGLVAEAERAGVPALIVEEEEREVRRLRERGSRVLFGSIDEGVLERAHLGGARAIVANAGDDRNAAAILAARQLGFGGDVVALVDEPLHRPPLLLAGASAAYTPRHLLAAALAARACERISPSVSGLESVGRRLRVRELRVEASGSLAGRTLREAHLGHDTGALVLALWRQGRLTSDVGPETRLEARDVIVAAGSEDALRQLAERTGGRAVRGRGGRFVVAGYGEVGRVAVEMLRGAGEEVWVVDRRGGEGVDLQAEFLQPGTLAAARPAEAQAVLLALDQDAATLFATVVVRDAAPEVPILARVNQSANVGRIHRAGADFALSISQVAGQLLASRLLGEQAIEIEPHLRVVRLPADALDGRSLREAGLRERFGCAVVAVERGDDLRVALDPDFRFAAGDSLFVIGNRKATRRCAADLGREPTGS